MKTVQQKIESTLELVDIQYGVTLHVRGPVTVDFLHLVDQKAARAALSVRLDQLRKGIYHAPAQIPTLKTVAKSWLASKAHLRPSAQYVAENHISHIVPVLGDLRLDQVTVADVDRFR